MAYQIEEADPVINFPFDNDLGCEIDSVTSLFCGKGL